MKKEMSSMHMAIEFAKHLLKGTVSKKRVGRIGEESTGEEYHPAEFQLLLGQLEQNGEEVFKEYVSSVVDEGFDKDTSPIFHEIEQMNDQQKKDFHKAMIERVSKIKDSYPDNKLMIETLKKKGLIDGK